MSSPIHYALLIPATVLLAALPAAADEVVVFAAASLRNALDPAAQAFEAQTGHHVTVSYAGSNTLARQIVEGAPADVFISASEEWMDVLDKGGLLSLGTRRDLLGNDLVVVSGEPKPAALRLDRDSNVASVLGDGKLAMGFVDSVPAGQYGKQALERIGQWDAVKGNVAQTDNVRAALALVASGEARLGVVYATDAEAESRVHVVGQFAAATHDPIVYPAALTTEATDAADHQFFDWLGSDAARKFFEGQGFRVLPR